MDIVITVCASALMEQPFETLSTQELSAELKRIGNLT